MGDHRGYDRDPISDNGVIGIIIMLFVIGVAAAYVYFGDDSDSASQGSRASVLGSPIQPLSSPPGTVN